MPSERTGAEPAGLISRDFVLACAANFTFFGSMHSLLPVLPLYVLTLGGLESDVGMLMGAFTLTAVVVRPFVGLGVDNWRRKPFLLLGAAIFVSAAASYSLAASVFLLLLVRGFHGLGIACFTPAASTFIADIVPATRRGAAMGIYGMFSNISMSIGPVIGGMIMRAYGINTLFGASAVVALVSLVIVSLLREPPRLARSPGSPAAAGRLISRSALLPSFVMFALAFSYGSVISFLPLMAAARKIADFEVFFTVFALGLIASRAVAGELSDRLGRPAIVIPGMALAGCGLFLLSGVGDLPMLLFVAAIFGLGFGAVHPALTALTVDRADPADRGAAMATFGSAFDLGIGAGSMLLGFVLTMIDFATMYMAAAGSALVGLVVFIGVVRSAARRRAP